MVLALIGYSSFLGTREFPVSEHWFAPILIEPSWRGWSDSSLIYAHGEGRNNGIDRTNQRPFSVWNMRPEYISVTGMLKLGSICISTGPRRRVPPFSHLVCCFEESSSNTPDWRLYRCTSLELPHFFFEFQACGTTPVVLFEFLSRKAIRSNWGAKSEFWSPFGPNITRGCGSVAIITGRSKT